MSSHANSSWPASAWTVFQQGLARRLGVRLGGRQREHGAGHQQQHTGAAYQRRRMRPLDYPQWNELRDGENPLPGR
jgi:hypothetical protein